MRRFGPRPDSLADPDPWDCLIIRVYNYVITPAEVDCTGLYFRCKLLYLVVALVKKEWMWCCPGCVFFLVRQERTAVCLFCRAAVKTFHPSWPLMAGVHASALIRGLWTCHLIAEEAEQVITLASLMHRRGASAGAAIACSPQLSLWVENLPPLLCLIGFGGFFLCLITMFYYFCFNV